MKQGKSRVKSNDSNSGLFVSVSLILGFLPPFLTIDATKNMRVMCGDRK